MRLTISRCMLIRNSCMMLVSVCRRRALQAVEPTPAASLCGRSLPRARKMRDPNGFLDCQCASVGRGAPHMRSGFGRRRTVIGSIAVIAALVSSVVIAPTGAAQPKGKACGEGRPSYFGSYKGTMSIASLKVKRDVFVHFWEGKRPGSVDNGYWVETQFEKPNISVRSGFAKDIAYAMICYSRWDDGVRVRRYSTPALEVAM